MRCALLRGTVYVLPSVDTSVVSESCQSTRLHGCLGEFDVRAPQLAQDFIWLNEQEFVKDFERGFSFP